MKELAGGIHTLAGPLRFLGLEVGARMTVLELDGGLLVHSPLGVEPETLAPLGEVRWVVAPNKLHHLFVGPWVARGAEGWAAAGLPQKRPDVAFTGVLEGDVQPFGSDVEVVPLTCFGLTNEVLLHHRPSRTLITTDLVFNVPPTAPWLTRAAFTCACAYPGCRTSLLERVAMDRGCARQDFARILDLDFDRLIMAHGEVVETGGKDALAAAFAWLGQPATELRGP
ncbi:MAG: DUF4336 domain-containing protein [Myxococcales bacterium]|nr:DUF4336 domain-containing protein [Myxococcales bacterium]MCB9669618.1 DUF4336 domain-containing protein [Alphaproteobacteria bacterium]